MSEFDTFRYVHDRPVLQERHRPVFEQLSRDQAWRTYQRLAEAGLLNRSSIPTDGGSLFLVCKMAGLDHAGVVLTLCRERDDLGVEAIETLIGKKIDVGIRFGKTSTQKKVGTGTPRIGARPTTPVDGHIIRTVVPNPKKPGSSAHARYSQWIVGRTVSACLDAGLTRGDLLWDTEHGFIVLCTKEEWDRLQAGENIHVDAPDPSPGSAA